MNATIKKWGNSLALRIPSNLAKDFEIEDGSQVELILNGDELKITRSRKFTLDDLMKGMTPEDRPEELDTGLLGKELEILE